MNMTRAMYCRVVSCLLMCLALASCASAPQSAGVDGAGTETTATAEEAAADAAPTATMEMVGGKRVEVVQAMQPSLTVEEIRRRRELERKLDRRVKEYWALVKERNVNKAIGFVGEANSEEVKNALWRFLADYRIEAVDITEKFVDYRAEETLAKIETTLTVFKKGVVSAELKEMPTFWELKEGVWVIRKIDS